MENTGIYSVIAVMTTLGIGYREGTILAVLCLISHAKNCGSD